MERGAILLFHFVGLGLLVTAIVAGSILNRQYRKAPDLTTKATILRSLRPIGLLSPVGMLLMLVTGIGNMHELGYSALDLPGWLAYKIVFFAIAVISGVLFSVKSRRRAVLVQQLASGKAPADAEAMLDRQDRQITLFYVVLPLVFLVILALSITGRLGGQ